jgi:hypothetical protein
MVYMEYKCCLAPLPFCFRLYAVFSLWFACWMLTREFFLLFQYWEGKRIKEEGPSQEASAVQETLYLKVLLYGICWRPGTCRAWFALLGHGGVSPC